MIAIGAVILAAGSSRRMGTQKLLLPLGGRPVITRVFEAVATCAEIETIVVVTGRDGADLRRAWPQRHPEPRWMENPDTEGDMLSSLRCGLRALPPECGGVLVVLGDQPGVSPDLISRLLHAARAGPSRIVVPRIGSRRGHPVYLPARFFDDVLTGFEGVGLRGLLAAHPEAVGEVPVTGDAAMLDDIDTPQDYAALRRLAGESGADPLD